MRPYEFYSFVTSDATKADIEFLDAEIARIEAQSFGRDDPLDRRRAEARHWRSLIQQELSARNDPTNPRRVAARQEVKVGDDVTG